MLTGCDVCGQIERLFQEADEDGSGLIEFDEFQQLGKAMNPPNEEPEEEEETVIDILTFGLTKKMRRRGQDGPGELEGEGKAGEGKAEEEEESGRFGFSMPTMEMPDMPSMPKVPGSEGGPSTGLACESSRRQRAGDRLLANNGFDPFFFAQAGITSIIQFG